MRYLKIGFYAICFSPVLSLLVVGVAITGLTSYAIHGLGTSGYSWLAPIVGLTFVHSSIIAFQLFGIVLYLAGYRKERQKIERSPSIKLITASLVIWGMLLSYFVYYFYYHEVILWSMEPGVRELVIWDHLEYAAWILKGLLWVGAGLTILATSRAKRFQLAT